MDRSTRYGPVPCGGPATRPPPSPSGSRPSWIARWIEVDYGEYDCQPLSDVPAEVWREWRRNPDFRPPGGETLAEVEARVTAACDELFAEEGVGARAATATWWS